MEYVRRHWKYCEPGSGGSRNSGACEPEDLLDRIRSHSLCISGMAFQDVWNIDLERLQRCCIHVASMDGKLIPFCAYYLTDSRGRRLIDRPAGN
jgi:hypothetical protein